MRRRLQSYRVAPVVAALAFAPAMVRALAQSVPASPASTSGGETNRDFLDVLQRLDPVAIALIAIAALVLFLLGWRVFAMIRKERPARRKPRAQGKRAPTLQRGRSEDTLTRNSIQDVTDWGFDQNKRSAVGRAPDRSEGLAPLETSTQLPALEQNSMLAAVSPNELGRSPVQVASPYRTGTNPYYFRDEAVDHRIDVEEVADVLTQAELLVQLGDPKEAMNLLSRHIRENEQPGPQVWLMLLDLYRSTGRESQYNALGDGFRALFNAQVPPWTTTAGADRALEDYPQVVKRIQTGWPGHDSRAYLEGLLNDDRGGSRMGFSLSAYRDLLFLVDILDVRVVVGVEADDRADIERKLNL